MTMTTCGEFAGLAGGGIVIVVAVSAAFFAWQRRRSWSSMRNRWKW